ncbi:MAG: hypothetical protein K2P30_14135 [Lachnospiraceae bacterium]|nr:hypothetical protein [Lachnospiraceae bacterium]
MVINMEEKTVIRFIGELCSHAGESGEFAENFWQRLKNDREIYEEFVYYMAHGNFACKAKVEGYTAVDVMVWQMDHFKARLDADNSNMRQNGDRMILLAFDTLLCMRTEPDKYIYRMQSETGTDYPGKY